MVETRRFEATGKLDSTCTAPPRKAGALPQRQRRVPAVLVMLHPDVVRGVAVQVARERQGLETGFVSSKISTACVLDQLRLGAIAPVSN
jgi:hypothetical protein